MSIMYVNYKNGEDIFCREIYKTDDYVLRADKDNIYLIDLVNLKMIVMPKSIFGLAYDINELMVLNDPPLDQQGNGEI